MSETLHELKCGRRYFAEVLDGSATFIVRKNDRLFQKGDRVTLVEVDREEPFPMDDPYTGSTHSYGVTETGRREVGFSIGFVYPLDDSRVVFSLVRDRMDQ